MADTPPVALEFSFTTLAKISGPNPLLLRWTQFPLGIFFAVATLNAFYRIAFRMLPIIDRKLLRYHDEKVEPLVESHPGFDARSRQCSPMGELL